ncbi:MerR family transcriptional regulator [Atopobium fossor]|uniref:MerR family transcriptional regulator n=1 Tax=Atopobium fossor TaxID=39487 RepID=UPI0003FA86E0|nr:MerR family transcriptional regulator [Atopobium fossor]
MYHIKQAAQLAHVSVRTLHYYDHIGLLVPHKASNGYRYYTDEDLDTLQTVLYFKYLGFPLTTIGELLEQSKDDRLPLLEQQLELLESEQVQLNDLINTLRTTIQSIKEGIPMTAQNKFKGFTWDDGKEYEAEARKLYGDELIDESLSKQQGKEEQATVDFNRVFQQLALNKDAGLAPDAPQNQKLAHDLLDNIRRYGFDCSVEVFGYIGAGYSANPEFHKNIDQFGEGTAVYTSSVINAFVEKNK